MCAVTMEMKFKVVLAIMLCAILMERRVNSSEEKKRWNPLAMRRHHLDADDQVGVERNKKLFVNYPGDFMLGALFPIHRRGSGTDMCDKMQVYQVFWLHFHPI